MMHGITFNDTHSGEFNLKILSTRRPLLPETKDVYIDIPGKNGSVLVADLSSPDIIVYVDFLIVAPEDATIYEIARSVADWLLTHEREKLIFDDDPNYYYNAKVVGNIELEKVVSMGKFTVQFRCSPYPEEV